MVHWNNTQLTLFFLIYSVIGWMFESLFCTIFIDKKPVNRGFLAGPLCPIYGLGGVIVLLATAPFRHSPVMVFLAALALTSALEYFTSWLLEALFQMRWWDYSHCKFNIKGRICLKNALFFGLMGLGVTFGLHPHIERLVNMVPPAVQRLAASLGIVLVFIDLLHTVGAINALSERANKLKTYVAELERYNEQYTWLDLKDLHGSFERLRDICREDTDNQTAAAIIAKLDDMIGKRNKSYRVTKNARMQVTEMQAALESLRSSWEARNERFVQRVRKGAVRLRAGIRETVSGFRPAHRGLSMEKMVLVFTVASLLGFLVETLYCLVTNGYIESRQGMLYGPFNQIYGFGAVVLVLLLEPLGKKSERWLFPGCAVVGGCFEALCHWLQESLFGSVSWDYSGNRFAIAGGRTSLTFVFFWAILGSIYIKAVYPRLSGLIDRIAKRQKAFLAWVLAIFLTLNMALSALAVARWINRVKGEAPQNAVGELLDQYYPDDIMEEIFPNMKPV